MKTIIVFSHLRWDFVYQRPQQLMTRLAAYYRIFFVEEPIFDPAGSSMELTTPRENIQVCRPHTSVAGKGFHDDQLSKLQPLLEELLVRHQVIQPLVWLYTPMALPLVPALEPAAVIYDCMDELSAFFNAPRQLLQRERALLKVADLVFTGGTSLYNAKRTLHHNVHCFPSGVEKAHFAAALDSRIDHVEQKHLGWPRLGFFGVIDERLDLALLATLADAHPEWQLILVGPVVKIDPATLPRRANIRYFGQRPYAELPGFVAGWDVCLLPFAINAATRFISPTKTLEYMAAEKPIVSTAIVDVSSHYGEIVHIAESAREFTRGCEIALDPAHDRTRERVLMRAVIAANSWDATASRMHDLIEDLDEAPLAAESFAPVSLPPANPQRVIVIGAGPTGLSAALHLGTDSLLLEQNERVGGWCRSIEDEGFIFDYAGHIMFSNDPYVHGMYEKLLGDNVHWQDREAWIYSHDVYTRYPFQGALFGLPPAVLRDCLVGAIEARFGPLQGNRCLTGADASRPNSAATAANFEEFIHAVWGDGVATHFALPYNKKLWTVPLSEMETSWLGGRVPMPDLEQMIDGALRPVAKPMGPNARFGYPLRGGFQALMDGFLPHLAGSLRLDAQVARVIPSQHRVVLGDGTQYTYEQLISTMPLPVLVELIGEEAPTAVKYAAARLQHVSVRCVNLGIARSAVTDKHWIYYPGDSVFHRVFVQGNASPHVNPPGGFGLTCEISYSPLKPLPCEGDALIQRCIDDCRRVHLLLEDDAVIVRNQVDMPYAYVVYDHARAVNVEIIRRWLGLQDIWLAGRYSEWEYYNSDHAFLAGRRVAAEVSEALNVGSGGADRPHSVGRSMPVEYDRIMKPLEIWGGVECTVNRVGNSYYNQLDRTGHTDRPDDLNKFAELGIRTLRYPILWELNAPDLDVRTDWKWARDRLARLQQLDITPIVGLVHHGSGPCRTGLTHDGFARGLAAFAGAVASQFPWVEWYTPVNEPLTTARFSGLYGLWYPHGRTDHAFARALINQCRATVLAMRAIREINPSAKLVQTEDVGHTYSTPAMRYQADFNNERRWLGWDLLCGRVGLDHPLRSFLLQSGITERELEWFCERPCPPQLLGINHYVTSDRFLDERLDRYPCRHWGGSAANSYADVEAVRVIEPARSSWSKALSETWERYHLPIALTEVHLGCTREEQLRWFAGAWGAAQQARAAGVSVVGVTAWALLGSFDWDSLLTRNDGHYEPGAFDIRGAEPHSTALAHLIRELVHGRLPAHPVLDSPGWWQRSRRLLYGAHGDGDRDVEIDEPPPQGNGRPLLVWSSGNTADAFSCVCQQRGLALKVSPHPCDDASAVIELLARIEPWALICADHCVPQYSVIALAEQRGMPLLILRPANPNLPRAPDGSPVGPDLHELANRALDLLIDEHSRCWHLTTVGLWRYEWRLSTAVCGPELLRGHAAAQTS